MLRSGIKLSQFRARALTIPIPPTAPPPPQFSTAPLSISEFLTNPKKAPRACSFSFRLSHSLSRRTLQEDSQSHEFNRHPTDPPKLFVVQPRLRPKTLLRAKLDEALNLANSLEEQRDGYYDTEFSERELPPHAVVQNPAARSPRPDTYFGPGTVKDIKCHLNASDSEGGLDAVFVNAILTGIQQRNLEHSWGKPVLDRIGLIIEIFNAHAFTKEAKLQAELAALTYKKTRLVRVRGPGGRYTFGVSGEAEVVSARGRGSGGQGFLSGAGETELQLQRRRILERRSQLLSEIKEVRRTRTLQRASRKRYGCLQREEAFTIAVVGYTNAGKSTLVSALSYSDLYCDDRLFATVDPTLRSVILPSGRKVFFSDTVGFISNLPVQLIEAFHATLEEVVEADLLLHVLDASALNLEEQRDTVLQVLKQIGVSKEKLENMIEVWNKIDLQGEDMGIDEYVDEDEVSSYSNPEDDEITPEQFSGDNASEYDDDNDKNAAAKVAEDFHNLDDEEGDCSDGWLLSGDEQERWGDHEGSYVGLETADNQQKDLSKEWKITRKDEQSQTESSLHVKTSAIMGIGLQELLVIIDERLANKLKDQKTVVDQEGGDRSIFERKWRPSRREESNIVVEQ